MAIKNNTAIAAAVAVLLLTIGATSLFCSDSGKKRNVHFGFFINYVFPFSNDAIRQSNEFLPVHSNPVPFNGVTIDFFIDFPFQSKHRYAEYLRLQGGVLGYSYLYKSYINDQSYYSKVLTGDIAHKDILKHEIKNISSNIYLGARYLLEFWNNLYVAAGPDILINSIFNCKESVSIDSKYQAEVSFSEALNDYLEPTDSKRLQLNGSGKKCNKLLFGLTIDAYFNVYGALTSYYGPYSLLVNMGYSWYPSSAVSGMDFNISAFHAGIVMMFNTKDLINKEN